MIREILEYPDARLREVAKPVAEVTPEIQALVDDMAETMYDAPGCGLAATQLGIAHRIFVVDCASEDEPSQLLVFINPEITEKDGVQNKKLFEKKLEIPVLAVGGDFFFGEVPRRQMEQVRR